MVDSIALFPFDRGIDIHSGGERAVVRDDDDHRSPVFGRLIRHASTASPVHPHPIPVIQTPFIAALMAPIGLAQRTAAGGLPAPITAVDLPPVTIIA
jgi:hypothetical protein